MPQLRGTVILNVEGASGSEPVRDTASEWLLLLEAASAEIGAVVDVAWTEVDDDDVSIEPEPMSQEEIDRQVAEAFADVPQTDEEIAAAVEAAFVVTGLDVSEYVPDEDDDAFLKSIINSFVNGDASAR